MGSYLGMSAVPGRLGKGMGNVQSYPGRQTWGTAKVAFPTCLSPGLSVKMVFVLKLLGELRGLGDWVGRGGCLGIGNIVFITFTQVAKKDRLTLENSLLIPLLCCCSF